MVQCAHVVFTRKFSRDNTIITYSVLFVVTIDITSDILLVSGVSLRNLGAGANRTKLQFLHNVALGTSFKFNAGLAMIEHCLKENIWRCK